MVVRVIGVMAAVLVLAGAARAGVIVGVNDDAAKNAGQVGWLYPALGAEGLQDDAITLRWDDGSPAAIPDEAEVQKALDLAAANGVTVELDLFPLHSQVFSGAVGCSFSTDPEGCGDTPKIQQFADWVGDVARAFPTVRQFVVMNECNQPLFVNPQWDQSGQNQSAEICGRALAASYDELKSVSPRNFVWGVGLSPRGNDNPAAASNSSTSPVMFLRALGTWFRSFAAKTGRTRPLMDGLDFHPYPIPQSQPFAQGYTSPNDASVSNLPRIYQAFYDGFNGTPQPTIGQQAGGGLPLSLNEVGVQTDSSGRLGYVGTETSANAAGGVIGQFATETYQASWYQQLLDLLVCDPNVRVVNIYHLIDEAGLAGWQSGLYYLDRSAKASAAVVHDWIANTGGVCQGSMHQWTPPGVAARPTVPPTMTPSRTRVVVAVGGRLRIFDAATHALRRVLAPFGAGYTGPLSVALGAVNRDDVSDFAVAEGAGTAGAVKVLDGKSGKPLAAYFPFPASFRGGATVALGDVTGDGRADVVVGSGPGMQSKVKVYDSSTRRAAVSVSPFARPFLGGVSVAAADVNRDKRADVIVGSGPGIKSTVAVFDGTTRDVLDSFSPFTTFRGGVSVAAARLAGDPKPDLVVASGSGTTAVVRAFAFQERTPRWSIDAFSSTFTGGAAVAAGVLTGSSPALVVGAGAGGGSQVKVLDGSTHLLLASFLGAPGSGAVSVAAG